MTLLDGKKLSQKILEELRGKMKQIAKKVRLAVIVVGSDPATQSFISQKRKVGESIGIDVRLFPFPETITTNELRKRIAEIVHEKKNTGVITQLPLPASISTQYILNAIPPEKDVDVLSARSLGNFTTGKSIVLPPIVGAVKAFFEEYQIDYKNKYIVVLGAGNLVGRPMALWLLNEKATFSVVRSSTKNPEEFLSKADIIISGIGKPRFVTGDMIKDGVVVIDAGTSEAEGKLVGDVDFDSVSQKALCITPVPGGIGPVTVAILFQNLITPAKPK